MLTKIQDTFNVIKIIKINTKHIPNVITKNLQPTILNIILFIIIFIGLLLRTHNINFGLFHSFYADEPEFVEFAIKYTFELKDIILNNNWYKLVPISYVYGTVPTYILTIFTTIFVQIWQLLGFSFKKIDIYVLSRIINLLVGFLMVPTIYYLSQKMFNNKLVSLLSAILVLLNYKLVIHSHYVNADLFLTSFLLLSFLFFYLYFNVSKLCTKNFCKQSIFLVLSAIFVGLSVGTKITSLINIFLYWFIIISKKDIRGFIAFNFIIFGTFALTNPFSILFIHDFVYRVYSMSIKEAGMVFDSVDYGLFKYLYALNDMVTFPVFVGFLYGVFLRIKSKKFTKFDLFLILNLVVYLVFYSLQARRVDRWLLPILSVVFIYCSYGIQNIFKIVSFKKSIYKFLYLFLIVVCFFYYNYFNFILVKQFQRNTPKSSAYLWLQQNIDFKNPLNNILSYTEEGLDPLNKLPNSNINQFNLYQSNGAHLFFPSNPYLYEYIVLSSRTMQNYKKDEVVNKYPYYAKRWEEFENIIVKSNDFKLIKHFKTTNPNLIPLSEVYIYKKSIK